MRIPIIAWLCWCAAFLAAAAPVARADRGPPNILFILTDDQPYKTVGCYPEAPDWVRTPHIDRLAAGGIRFERAYLGAWCMPARASLLTGTLQHGIESMRMAGPYPGSTYDPAACPFIPAELRRQGYQTAHIGKWHTGTDSGFGRDWDHQVVWNRPKLPENAGAYYEGQVLAFNGEERRVDGYSTDVYTDLACDYIRGGQRAADKPWFLWLCYGAVHGPTTPAPRHAGTLAGHDVPVPADIFGPRPGKPAYLDATQAWDRGPDGQPVMRRRGKSTTNFDANLPGRSHADWVRQVNECALAIDDGLGRLLAALAESGQLEDTLVVFTSDQGFALGEHGLSMKLAPYDAAIASPLIMSRPGTVPAGVVRSTPVNAADIAVTLCGAAGVKVPWPTHGRDFGHLLADAAEPAPSPMLLTNTARAYGSDTNALPVGSAMFEQSGVPWWVMLRDGRHKYIRTLVSGEVEEVYDLAADPEELENLAVVEAHRPLLERLRATALAELRRTGAGFVAALPEAATEAKTRSQAKARPQAKASRPARAAREQPAAPAPTLANVKYGSHERHVLDLWKADSSCPAPLVFVIHGGGWVGGDKDRVGRFVDVEKLLAGGISVAAINYRLIPRTAAEGVEPPVKAPLHDAARALQFVRSKAAEWKIDPRRIGAAGGSAGACSSLWLAFHDDLADPRSADPVARESTRLACAAVVGAQTTLDPAQMREWTPNSNYGGHAFGLTGDAERKLPAFEHFLAERERILPWIAEYSPYALVTGDDPPVYLSYGGPPAIGKPEKDPTHSCNFGLKLKERCDALGVACELSYPGSPDLKHATGTDFLIATLGEPAAAAGTQP